MAGERYLTVDIRLVEWFASGDTGASSKAIAFWLSAGIRNEVWGAPTPADPSDLGRCLRLLDRIPEWKLRMPEMAGAGGLWPTFVKRWDEMAASMAEEVGVAWEKGESAPKTYDLMKSVEKEARAHSTDAPAVIDLGNGVSMSFGR